MAHIGGGHAEGFVLGGDAADDFGMVGVAGDEGVLGVAEFDGIAGFGVEAEFGFTIGGVGAVAGEAFVGEDGADVAVELDGLGGEREREEEKNAYAAPGKRKGGHCCDM